MAVIIQNKAFNRALQETKKTRHETDVAVVARAGSSLNTLKKMKRGDEDLSLNAIDRLASALGLDTEVRFVKRAAEPAVVG